MLERSSRLSPDSKTHGGSRNIIFDFISMHSCYDHLKLLQGSCTPQQPGGHQAVKICRAQGAKAQTACLPAIQYVHRQPDKYSSALRLQCFLSSYPRNAWHARSCRASSCCSGALCPSHWRMQIGLTVALMTPASLQMCSRSEQARARRPAHSVPGHSFMQPSRQADAQVASGQQTL